jgi:hypothetical protein
MEQPHTFLIDSIKERDQQIQRSQTIMKQLYEQISNIQQV